MEDSNSVCVIGHVTRDHIRIQNGTSIEQPGGTAFYAGCALASLGVDVRVVTRMATADAPLLYPLRGAGANIDTKPSPVTTVFENRYDAPGSSTRTQLVPVVATPFMLADLTDVPSPWILLGPLCAMDMDVDFIMAAASKSAVALDVQGLVRIVEAGTVSLRARGGLLTALAQVAILKADRAEAACLTGQDDPVAAARTLQALGPREVVITLGATGSLVVAGDAAHRLPAFPVEKHIDATGCGDTYFAGYLFRRLRGDDPLAAAQFASVLASLKFAQLGPFTGTEEAVTAARQRLA